MLLVVSAIEAYHIQRTASNQNAEIYRRHLKQQELLYRCRRYFFMGGIYARDFLLDPRSERAEVFRSRLTQLSADSEKTMDELAQMPSLTPYPVALKSKLQDYLAILYSIASWTEERRLQSGFGLVQQEITPRRNAAGELLREVEQVLERALRESESAFARSNSSAALRLLLMLTLSLVLGLAAAYLSLSHSENLERENNRRYGELQRAQQDLQRLSCRLLEVQEEERRRISRELHDEIGQALTALRIEISQALTLWKNKNPGIQNHLEQARSLAEKSVQTVRDISLLLRPPLLDDLGLGPALQWQAQDFTRRTGIPCDFSEDGLHGNLPDAHRTCVYRIVQEALHNCQMHAAASRLRLSVRREQDRLVVETEDDGRGIGHKQQGRDPLTSGLGILGMRERASMLGGAFDIHSSPGIGTRVTLTLPAPETASDVEPANVEEKVTT